MEEKPSHLVFYVNGKQVCRPLTYCVFVIFNSIQGLLSSAWTYSAKFNNPWFLKTRANTPQNSFNVGRKLSPS